MLLPQLFSLFAAGLDPFSLIPFHSIAHCPFFRENSSPHTVVFPSIIPMRIPRILYTALIVHSGSTHVESSEQFNICYY